MLIITLLLTWNLLPWQALASTIRVLQSEFDLEDGSEVMSGARLIDDRAVAMSDFSLCIRFNVKVLHKFEGVRAARGNTAPIVFIGEWRDTQVSEINPWFQFNAESPKSYIVFGHPFELGSYHSWLIRDSINDRRDIWRTFEWNHLCFSYQKSNSFVKVGINGQIMSINFSDERVRNVQLPSNILQNVHIGKCPKGTERLCSALGAKFADLNIWERPLTDDELIAFTSCRDKGLKGNVVDWGKSRFELFNMTEIDEEIETICEMNKPENVLIVTKNSFVNHMAMCDKLRGEVSVMKSPEERQLILDLRQLMWDEHQTTCWGNIWTGHWDKYSEGTFVNANNKTEKLAFNPWFGGEPNGGKQENCAAEISGPGWIDADCAGSFCGFCYLERAPVLKMRGLCPQSNFDSKYTWTGELIDQQYAFYGIHKTLLHYNKEKEQWHLSMYSAENNATYAVVKGKEIPFGTKNWRVFGDVCNGNGSLIEPVETPLSLNGCTDDEFNCMDGACQPIEKRCDGRIDCLDRSDELDCQIFSTGESYLQFMPPAGETEDTLFPVKTSVEVLNILGISEVDNFIDLQLHLHFTWKDDRLELFNLKVDRDLNSLTYEMREQIWLPEIVFYNTDEKYESINDLKASAIVERNGSFEGVPLSNILNRQVFKGSENPIIYSRVYNYKYLCDFDMQDYPFDAQNCSAIFTLKGNTAKFVELVPDELDFVGPVELAQYFVRASYLQKTHIRQLVKGVKLELIFGRRLLSIILTTYLPTIFICIVAFTSNFYEGFFFEAIVTVNLTSMLLLVTLFISVSESLPKTAYIKNIDVWLIFVLFIPFCEVVIHTLIDNLREDEDRDINHHGTIHTVTDNDPDLFEDDTFDILPKKNNTVHVLEANDGNSNGNEQPKEVTNLDDISHEDAQRARYLKMLLFTARNILPAAFVAFSVGYFVYGAMIYNMVVENQ